MRQDVLAGVWRPLAEAGRDLAPIALIIAAFEIVLFGSSWQEIAGLLASLIPVWLGLALFVRGLALGVFPAGEALAEGFVRRGSLPALLVFAFLLGFATTIAEPALAAVAAKAAQVAAQGGWIAEVEEMRFALELRLVVALSVGAAIVLGVLRILFAWPLAWMVLGGYVLVGVLTPLAPPAFVGIAYDAGGVTTSTITVPLVTALGVGLAASIEGRSPLLDGFGMIALASLLPILFVLLYGMARA